MWSERKKRELWHLAAAAMIILALATLATVKAWPFDAAAVGVRDGASIADRALGDRITIGLIRTAVLTVVAYLVISVPALVIDRRWIQGVTTTGLTADAGDRSKRLEEFGEEIARIRRFLATKSDQPDAVSDTLDFTREDGPSGEVTDGDG